VTTNSAEVDGLELVFRREGSDLLVRIQVPGPRITIGAGDQGVRVPECGLASEHLLLRTDDEGRAWAAPSSAEGIVRLNGRPLVADALVLDGCITLGIVEVRVASVRVPSDCPRTRSVTWPVDPMTA
jgi:hypothetical protein